MVLDRRGADVVQRGHPWIYASAVRQAPSDAGIVRLVADGEPIGCGVYDPASPIAVRVWSRRPVLDASVFSERLERALAVRRELFASGTTTAYRLLNGEGDRTPGVVIDRYADVAVLRLDGEGIRAALGALDADLEARLRAAGITTLLERTTRKDVVTRFGPSRARVTVAEHGVPFEVDLAHGQKTGAFLDQRENRRRVGEIVRRRKEVGLGTRVLNLFSYAGGFSQRAAIAGGTVTSVDIAAQAHATAEASFRLAGVDPSHHEFVTADAFVWLESAKKRALRWDVVVSDPPSFAPSEKAKPKAIAAYRSLHRACASVLAEGGVFVAASCSSHVTAEDFAATLDDAALARSDLRLLELHGPPPDHPTLPAFPEGRYLKCAVLA